MAEIMGATMPNLPSFGIGTGVLWIVSILFIVTVVVAIVMYVLYMKRIYNKKIVVFENISGQGFQPVFKDTARLIRLGDGGEELLYLRGKRVYRTAYGKKMGKNTYWFVIGQDGYWYNCVLGDLDAKMGMLDIEPIDRDMRYMHVAIRKNITERYRKIGFMERYGTMVFSLFFLLIMIGGIWYLLDKVASIASANAGALTSSQQTMEMAKQVISSLDNICTGGRGVVPA